MKKMTALFAGAMVLLAACNKEKRNEVTKENLVGTYTLVASETQVGTDPAENDLLTMPACEKDDLIKLNGDMTYNSVDAGAQCDPNGNDTGVWSLPSSAQIVVDGRNGNIKSFDGRRLVIEYSTWIADTPVRNTITLSKQ